MNRDIQLRDDITPYTSPVFAGVGVVLSDLVPKELILDDQCSESVLSPRKALSSTIDATAAAVAPMISNNEVDTTERLVCIAERIPANFVALTPLRQAAAQCTPIAMPNTPMDNSRRSAVHVEAGNMAPPQPPQSNTLFNSLLTSTPIDQRTGEWVEAFSYVNTPQTIGRPMRITRELVIPVLPQRVELEGDEVAAVDADHPEVNVPEELAQAQFPANPSRNVQDVMSVMRDPSVFADDRASDVVGAVANLFQTDRGNAFSDPENVAVNENDDIVQTMESHEEADTLEESLSSFLDSSGHSVFEDIVEVEDALTD